jgi:hypothetical protein
VVKVWKVIFAVLVIFAAGVVTGGLTVRLKLGEAPVPAGPPAGMPGLRQRGDLLDRLQRQLYLTPIQRDHIELILRENHDRMKQLWDSVAPQAQAEHRRVHDLIKAELTPAQQKQFEEIMKSRPANRPGEERRRREDRREPKATRRPEPPGLLPPAGKGDPAKSPL